MRLQMIAVLRINQGSNSKFQAEHYQGLSQSFAKLGELKIGHLEGRIS